MPFSFFWFQRKAFLRLLDAPTLPPTAFLSYIFFLHFLKGKINGGFHGKEWLLCAWKLFEFSIKKRRIYALFGWLKFFVRSFILDVKKLAQKWQKEKRGDMLQLEKYLKLQWHFLFCLLKLINAVYVRK